MSITIGLVGNIYNEINALPGWLETGAQFFDHISVYHAGPGGAESNDGTIELLEKWKIPIHRGKIDEGFGIVRTAAVRSSPCDWVMLLDADERFYAQAPSLTCSGDSTPPEVVTEILTEYDKHARKPPSESGTGDDQWQSFESVAKLGANLKVSMGESYNQGSWLRGILEHHTTINAVCTIRRHWHDFSWKRPTQNWHQMPDYQARVIRNIDGVHFNPTTKMHEQLMGASNRYMPNHVHGPFFDHYHLFYKRMEPAQRAHDVRIYDAIHWGHEVPSK